MKILLSQDILKPTHDKQFIITVHLIYVIHVFFNSLPMGKVPLQCFK